MEKKLELLLYMLSLHGRSTSKFLSEVVLRHCKSDRKGLSPEVVKAKGLDIYPNRDTSIDDLISYAINNGLIDLVKGARGDDYIDFTDKGLEYTKAFLTNNFCSAYIAYEKQLNEGLKGYRLPLESLQIMKLFWSKVEVGDAINTYLKPNAVFQDVKAYTEQLFRDRLAIDVDNKVVFNLFPKLFVPIDMIDKKVNLTIEGVDTPINMVVNKPYPNKRYFVAGMKIDKSHTASGIYPIVETKDSFPKHLKIKLIWEIQDVLTVIHYLDLTFAFTGDIGNMFCTEQHFNQCCFINSFDLTTYVENEKEFYRDRTIEYETEHSNKTITISEKATLNNAPIEYFHHYMFDSHAITIG
jgi:hypothetical protein